MKFTNYFFGNKVSGMDENHIDELFEMYGDEIENFKIADEIDENDDFNDYKYNSEDDCDCDPALEDYRYI